MHTNDFTHLLLTRFNLDFSLHNGKPYTCDDEWHQDRFQLFNTYCLPSVAAQTTMNFEWIIFFNEEKRALYQSFVETTEQAFQNTRFLFVKPSEDHRQNLIRYIKENCTSKYLITTRIDNDDCISNHFIESIQKKFMERHTDFEKEFVLNAGTGYQYEVKFPYRKTLISNYEFSPFLSLFSKLEHSGVITTVLKHSHHRWKEYEKYEELPGDPFWAQIVHKKNVSNRILSLNLYTHILDEHFPVFRNAPKNKRWFGFLMLPLQVIMTAVKRVVEKLKKH